MPVPVLTRAQSLGQKTSLSYQEGQFYSLIAEGTVTLQLPAHCRTEGNKVSRAVFLCPPWKPGCALQDHLMAVHRKAHPQLSCRERLCTCCSLCLELSHLLILQISIPPQGRHSQAGPQALNLVMHRTQVIDYLGHQELLTNASVHTVWLCVLISILSMCNPQLKDFKIHTQRVLNSQKL